MIEISVRHKRRKSNVCKELKKILDVCNFVVYTAESFCRGIAQLVEHRSPKPRVVSSNLTAPANKKATRQSGFFIGNRGC